MSSPDLSRRRTAEVWSKALAAILLVAMAFNMLSVIERKSITNDETVLIPAGYYLLVHGNTQLLPEQPPLPKILAALALSALQLRSIEAAEHSKPVDLNSPDLLQQFWVDNLPAYQKICFWARVPAIVLTVALGVLIFLFACELFGPIAAALAVALFTLEPTVLAHGTVAGTDMPAAFGYALLFYFLMRFVSVPNRRRAAALGASAGVACVCKFSMLIAVPVMSAAFLVMFWRARGENTRLPMLRVCERPPLTIWPLLRFGPRRRTIFGFAFVALAACILVINAVYLFNHRALSDVDFANLQDDFPSNRLFALIVIKLLSLMMPPDFLIGAIFQVTHNTMGHVASLLGMHSDYGWRYYFPVAFALKVPLSFLLLSVMALCWGVYQCLVNGDRRYALLLIGFTLYLVMCALARINIGIRYFLPAYPFLFILAGAMLARLMRAHQDRATWRPAFAAVAAFMIWTAYEAIEAFPDYMSYMSQITAGQPKWQYLTDSNIEWGEDVQGLAAFLHEKGETRVQAELLGATWTLRFHGIQTVGVDPNPKSGLQSRPRYAALGASFLNGSSVPKVVNGKTLTESERINFFDAYRHLQPATVIGGSIYVFRVAE